MSIEKVDDVNIEVSLKPFGIHFSSMHNFDDFFVFHDAFKQGYFSPDGKNIDNVVFFARGHLDQASEALVALV